MASRIEALSGPNKGWAYRFRATEVHIGRGAGHHIRLDDPAWQQGHLRLQHVQAGWLVTNNLPHPIYLDGEVLPEHGQRTWYHGTKLQPTAATVLVLFDDEGEGLPQKGNGVVAVPPTATGPQSRTTQYAVVIGLVVLQLLLMVFLFGMGGDDAPEEAVPLSEAIAALKKSPQHSGPAERVAALLAEARYREASGRPVGALKSYLAARDELDRVPGGRLAAPDEQGAEEWEPVHRHVGQRVAELARRYGVPRSK
jgi:hypothetical protein